jgi:hypothetical protein
MAQMMKKVITQTIDDENRPSGLPYHLAGSMRTADSPQMEAKFRDFCKPRLPKVKRFGMN